MESWHSYPKVYNLGHPAIEDLFLDDVVVEEKVDGSQFSFAMFGGELHVRSKGRVFHPDAADKMFLIAVEQVQEIAHLLHDGWTYRAEYLQRPKHNALAYDRVPQRHLMLFDVGTGNNAWLRPDEREAEAHRIGVEIVPVLHRGRVGSANELQALLDRVSVLGGQQIEGVVAKNYSRFGRDGKTLMGKHVSEAFKEVHSKEWKKSNPSGKDVLSLICDEYRSDARWSKAVIHLRESDELEGTPRDIGTLMKAVQSDVLEECEEEIKEKLWRWAKKHVLRTSTRGLPEWYKAKLMEGQFHA